MSIMRLLWFVCVLFTQAHCAMHPVPADHYPVSRAEQALATLQELLTQAEAASLPLFAPQSYAEAQALFNASRHAQRRNSDSSAALADSGITTLHRAHGLADQVRHVFAATLEARQKARLAGADKLLQPEFAAIEQHLKKACAWLESGHRNIAKEHQQPLRAEYLLLAKKAKGHYLIPHP